MCGKRFLYLYIIFLERFQISYTIFLEASMGVSVNAQYQRSDYVRAIYR